MASGLIDAYFGFRVCHVNSLGNEEAMVGFYDEEEEKKSVTRGIRLISREE
jgi:hypothetical protein